MATLLYESGVNGHAAEAAAAFVRHVPLIAKQPVVRFTPAPNVEVALVARLRAPAMVVEPVFDTRKSVVVALPVEEAISKRLRLVSNTFAKILSLAFGVVVPMPTAVPVSKMEELLKEKVVPFHFGT